LHSAFSLSSERQLETELNIPTRRRAVDLSEIAAIRIGVRIIQIDDVPGIEEVALELQSDFLSQGETLAQGKVPQIATWPFDHANARCAAAIVGRVHKRPCVEPFVERSGSLDILPRSVSAPRSDGTVACWRQ